MKPGIYETTYGNIALVSGPTSKYAWDIDQVERIPINLVDETKFIRAAKASDRPSPERRRQSMW